jgi:arylformamidase
LQVLFDISPEVSAFSSVFPGDEPFSLKWLSRTGEGASASVSVISMTPHDGAHADAPLHIAEGGADIAGCGLAPFLGPCFVLDLSQGRARALIGADEVRPALGEKRVLVKTRTVAPSSFSKDFRALSPEAAAALRDAGAILVGIDTPSIDPFESTMLPSHRETLGRGVPVLENLVLGDVPGGRYTLVALPLRLRGAEASPVRAVLCAPQQAEAEKKE